MTTTIKAVYEHGVLKPLRRLPLREHATITLILHSKDPVSRSRAAFHLPKRIAKALIYDDSFSLLGA